MKRILVVDDEPHVIRVMRISLENAGYCVDEAANGMQAIAYLETTVPDVLITDIDMPRMNGMTLCREISQRIPDRDFRIIVLTARAEIEHRDWAGELSNLSFMEKPVSIRRLMTDLEEYFRETVVQEKGKCRQAL